MYRISPQSLAWSLENLVSGNIVNEIKVEGETKELAMVALERMISLTDS
jgi:quinolinate synthase